MKYIATTIASICITTVLLFGIAQGFDGMLITGGIVILGGLGGYTSYSVVKESTKS